MWLKFMRSGKICAAGVPCVPQDDLGFVWTIPTTLLAPQSSYTNLPEPKEERTARDQVKGYAGILRHVLKSRVSHVLLVPRLHDLPAPTPSLPMVQLQMNRPWDDATEDEKWRGSPPGFTVHSSLRWHFQDTEIIEINMKIMCIIVGIQLGTLPHRSPQRSDHLCWHPRWLSSPSGQTKDDFQRNVHWSSLGPNNVWREQWCCLRNRCEYLWMIMMELIWNN